MKSLIEQFITAVKSSPDPLSTAFGWLVAYLYINEITLHDIAAWFQSIDPERGFRLILGLLMILISNRAYKKPIEEDPPIVVAEIEEQ